MNGEHAAERPARDADARFLAGLSNDQLTAVGQDRIYLWRALLDDGKFGAARSLERALAAVHRESEHRLTRVRAHREALAAFLARPATPPPPAPPHLHLVLEGQS